MASRLSVVALFVGGVLALPFATFVAAYDRRPVLALSVALVFFLPFAAYAVSIDRSPRGLFPPGAVLVGGGVVAAFVVSFGALTGGLPMALATGAVILAAALGYHGRYATTPVPSRIVGVGGVLLTVAVGVVGLMVGAPLASGVAVAAVAAATVDYHRERRWLTRPRRRVAASVVLSGGACVVVAGVVLDEAMAGVALAMALLVVGAALAVE
ncbi:hypothetical protein ACFPYI_09505 [Halomarina salina]|uniref:Phosphate ABC transporter permease n=1 Tax=Halomarina salina TaxID=1872699 RepID=A0ABD5RMP3_9EURY|nr:hypothetical protein [Halomarina salina]